MLQNFLICVGAVVPMAIYLIIGVILRRARVIGDRAVKKFTHVVFITLYPFLMFDNLYGKNLSEFLDVKIALFSALLRFFRSQ